jgi:para-nitrobenzyl esterase
MSAERLIEAAGEDGIPPLTLSVDGYFFPKAPGAIFLAGEQSKVPLLAGSNSQESSYEDVLEGKEPTVENYQAALKRLYGERAEEIAAYYAASSTQQVMHSATELASDRFLGFSTWKWVDVHGQTSEKPTYYYYYAHPRPITRADAKAGNKDAASAGAVHSAEIEYAMGNLDSNEVFAWNEDDYKVSEVMQAYFANFIKTGDPNGEGLPAWRSYNADPTHPRLTIDVNTRLGPDARRTRYLLLDSIENKEQ